MNLADISQKQGLLADAKARLNAVAAKRRARGDQAGTEEIVVLLGSLTLRISPARTPPRGAAGMGRAMRLPHAFAPSRGSAQKDRPAEALDALRKRWSSIHTIRRAAPRWPKPRSARGTSKGARRFLDLARRRRRSRPAAGARRIELKAGGYDVARELLPALLDRDADARTAFDRLAWTLAGSNPDAAWTIVEAVAAAAVARSEPADAVTVLQEFVTRVPRQIQALLKLSEVCVAGGLESTMYEAQAELADAYLATGQAAEARGIAEDLVAREPWERAHLERFRRALVMLRVDDPDSVIAERMSGLQPFNARDRVRPESSVSAEGSAPASEGAPPSRLRIAAEPRRHRALRRRARALLPIKPMGGLPDLLASPDAGSETRPATARRSRGLRSAEGPRRRADAGADAETERNSL